MPLASAVIGGSSGLFIAFFSNSVRKLPFFRRPWEHVLYMAIGTYIGYNYPTWENQELDKVNEMRAQRKLDPLVKSPWGFQAKP